MWASLGREPQKKFSVKFRPRNIAHGSKMMVLPRLH